MEAWRLDDHAFATELVVSERVTNVLTHATGNPRVRLIRGEHLTVEVSDDSTTSPHLRHARAQDENGRGLFIAATLAGRWGTRHGGGEDDPGRTGPESAGVGPASSCAVDGEASSSRSSVGPGTGPAVGEGVVVVRGRAGCPPHGPAFRLRRPRNRIRAPARGVGRRAAARDAGTAAGSAGPQGQGRSARGGGNGRRWCGSRPGGGRASGRAAARAAGVRPAADALAAGALANLHG
ncbi:ATP-binding protein [Streptomyces mirabilis]